MWLLTKINNSTRRKLVNVDAIASVDEAIDGKAYITMRDNPKDTIFTDALFDEIIEHLKRHYGHV